MGEAGGKVAQIITLTNDLDFKKRWLDGYSLKKRKERKKIVIVITVMHYHPLSFSHFHRYGYFLDSNQ